MKKNEEILNGQIGDTLQQESTQLIEKTEVEGTPFHIITYQDRNWIGLGKYRISSTEYTVKELKEKIFNMDYDFLINVIFAVIDMTRQMDKEGIIVTQNPE